MRLGILEQLVPIASIDAAPARVPITKASPFAAGSTGSMSSRGNKVGRLTENLAGGNYSNSEFGKPRNQSGGGTGPL